ncbi:MAG: hypothetical protein HYR49_04395 [Gammaproteobacteria bacterium]|nr:hypothetical protein [Gammaproteobacteria bacterium]
MAYFSSDFEFDRAWDHAVRKYFPGDGYDDGPADTLVVAKDVMLTYRKTAMEWLRRRCPSVKCVVLLRDPATRAYSPFHHAGLKGVETCETFEAALQLEERRAREDPDYWESTLYLRNDAPDPAGVHRADGRRRGAAPQGQRVPPREPAAAAARRGSSST